MIGALAFIVVAQAVEPLQMDDMVQAAERIRPFVARVDVHLPVPADQPLVPTEHWVFAIPWDESRLVALAPLVPAGAELEVIGPEGSAPARRVDAVVDRRVVLLRSSRPLSELGLKAPKRSPPPERLAHLFTLVGEGEGVTVASGQALRPAKEFGTLIPTDLKLHLGVPVFDEQLGLVGIGRTVAWDRYENLVIPSAVLAEAVETIEERPSQTEASKDASDEPARPWWAKEIPAPSAEQEQTEGHP